MVMASQTLAVAFLLASQQISPDSVIHFKSIDLSHHDLELINHAAFNVMFGSLAASRALLVADEKIKTYIPDILGFIVAAPLINMGAPAHVIEPMIAFMDNVAYTDLIDKDKPLAEKKFFNTFKSVMKSIPENGMDIAQLKKPRAFNNDLDRMKLYVAFIPFISVLLGANMPDLMVNSFAGTSEMLRGVSEFNRGLKSKNNFDKVSQMSIGASETLGKFFWTTPLGFAVYNFAQVLKELYIQYRDREDPVKLNEDEFKPMA
jgi:hypothetical protein